MSFCCSNQFDHVLLSKLEEVQTDVSTYYNGKKQKQNIYINILSLSALWFLLK